MIKSEKAHEWAGNSYHCDTCGSSYHCGACGGPSGMMGHSAKVDGEFVMLCQIPENKGSV